MHWKRFTKSCFQRLSSELILSNSRMHETGSNNSGGTNNLFCEQQNEN